MMLAVFGLLALLVAAWAAIVQHPERAAQVATAGGSGSGIALVSDRITLPEETAALPVGSDLITARCIACHSSEMIATQPVLGAEKWQATIDKMRTVYKARIDPGEDKALIAALLALPSQHASPAAR